MTDTSEIIILGSVRTSEEGLAELLEASLAHVHRSRAEDGCLSHAVHRDVEDPLLLVFVERWRDHDAVQVHFSQPGSLAFIEVVTRLAVGRTTLDIYQATRSG